MNGDEGVPRYCPHIAPEDEAALLQVARDNRTRWFAFSRFFPNGNRAEFMNHVLAARWPGEHTPALADCLFMQFVRLDLEITADDEKRLRRLAGRLHDDESVWPANENYFAVLERVVADEYASDEATLFRIRSLASRLSDLHMFDR